MLPIILLILFVLAWVILILPRQRELKRHQRLVAEVQPGDVVMMTSGIYGTILYLDDDYARLQVDDGVVLKIARRSIAAKVEDEPGQKPATGDGGETDESAESVDSADGSDGGSTTAVGQTQTVAGDSDKVRQPDVSSTDGDLNDEADQAEENEG